MPDASICTWNLIDQLGNLSLQQTLKNVLSSLYCCFFNMDMDMVSCLYFKIVSRHGWYVDIGALRCVTCDRSLLNMFQEQEVGMSVDLAYDATYHV